MLQNLNVSTPNPTFGAECEKLESDSPKVSKVLHVAAVLPASVHEVQEMNTDQGNGTHAECKKLHERGPVPANLMATFHTASPEDLYDLFQARRRVAYQLGLDLAVKAKAQKLSLAKGIFRFWTRKGFGVELQNPTKVAQ